MLNLFQHPSFDRDHWVRRKMDPETSSGWRPV